MGVADKLSELEAELARTQKNKATEFHIGILKAKIARLKREMTGPKKGGSSGGGFDVRKTGDSTVVFIGLPSVGKSTLLNRLTGTKSEVAAYAFTTLTCIPGMLEYKGAKIQLLDLPGIIIGASEGKGRGKEVLAVARSADLILIILDVYQPGAYEAILRELYNMGIRANQKRPDVVVSKKLKGGVSITSTVKTTKINERMVCGILGEYGIHNADVVLREDIDADQFIDVVVQTRKYAPALVVLNKTEIVSSEYLKTLKFDFIPVSAEKGVNMDALKEAIYKKLDLMRIFTKPRMGEADMKEPLMIRRASTVRDLCERLSGDLLDNFKHAIIWGKSAKFPGQKVGLDHVLCDGDITHIAKKPSTEIKQEDLDKLIQSKQDFGNSGKAQKPVKMKK
ncbi:GTP-binding protein [Candidatus Parvarchaeota archaeon]|nr:GTP-binding protein [Candidatus Parvarchaeota archaeon]